MEAIQAVLEQRLTAVAAAAEEAVDTELHRLETLREDDLDALRAQRLQALKRAASRKADWLARGHGEYSELGGEKEFFAAMRGEDRFVAHFYRASNFACKVVDRHLETLAREHLETRFVKIDAEKSPFLTEKLKVWMLPTLALVRSEKVVDYVVGFDQLGGRDDFTTDALRARLQAAGLLAEGGAGPGGRPGGGGAGAGAGRSMRQGGGGRDAGDEDSDFD